MAYKRVKYIETNKTYFQTSLLTSADTKVVLDMSLIELVGGDNGIFGNTSDWHTSQSFNIMVHNGRNQWGVYVGGTAFDYSGYYNLDNRCLVELTATSFKVYDTVLSSYTSDYSFSKTPTQASVGARIGSGLYNNAMGKYRFYEVTIYSGNTIVGHFLPYKDTTTGYGVLYDTVSNTYYSGYNPSSVIAGPIFFSFEEDVVNASYPATSATVTLDAEGLSWTATTVPSWVTVSPSSGSGTTPIVFNISENESHSERFGYVEVTSNDADTAGLTIAQEEAPYVVYDHPIYRSGNLVKKMYRSGELIYYKLGYSQPTPPDYKSMPLTFKVISGGTISWRAYDSGCTKDIQYSVNDGPWSSITSTTDPGTPISLNTGDVVKFKGDGAISTGKSAYNCFSGSTAIFEAYGNVDSLIDSTNYATVTTVADHSFRSLFQGVTGLTSAENLILPGTTVGNSTYKSMFQGCTSLTTAPVLPATTLAENCYEGMFYYCRSLTTAPALPATTLANYCYSSMFKSCTSLTTAPALPATTMQSQCYYSMFSGCTSLTTAPELPATTLGERCYQSMFQGCTSLTTAPELPAEILAGRCYYSMFRSCNNLNYIKCLAINPSTSTSNWVVGVASSGTFVTPSSTYWKTGTSGIPSGWTRVDA